MKKVSYRLCALVVGLFLSFMVLGCENPAGGSSPGTPSTGGGGGDGGGGGSGGGSGGGGSTDDTDEKGNPEILDFVFSSVSTESSKLRTGYAVVGTTAGSIGGVSGGTPPYTYNLVEGDGMNDADNSHFAFSGNILTIQDNQLSAGTYCVNIGVSDTKEKRYSKAVTVTIYPDPVLAERDIRYIDGINFAMRYIHSGSFISTTLRYAEDVEISSGFWIGETEVTQELYQRIMGTNPSFYSDNPAPGEIQSKRPVENITFYDALVFCNRLSIAQGKEPVYRVSGITDWVHFSNSAIQQLDTMYIEVTPTADGYRLPSEYEWQWAAMGADYDNPGQKNLYGHHKRSAGMPDAGDEGLENYCWYYVTQNLITHEVAKKLPNEIGLFDMSGNATEYVGVGYTWIGKEITMYGMMSFLDSRNIVPYPAYEYSSAGFRIVSNR
ncbi:MAG: formylglycine-generating enzyme family protein [Prevotella sp.]|jgi:hypothetical protein|nr:formylglycine-generating enzyme family protein [Prevotella sp.]